MIKQGDCLTEMLHIPDGSIDMVLTDPPYGITACKWDSMIPMAAMWAHLKRIVKPNGAIVLFGSQPFTSALVMSNPRMFKYSWVWRKSQSTGHLSAWKMPMRAHEDILVFCKKSTSYYPQLQDKPIQNIRPITNRTKTTGCYGSHKLDIHRCPPDKSMPSSVVEFNNAQSTVHPTQKPTALLEYLIKTYTNEGETVLDFAMGSASTGVACQNTNRNFIGIEIDKTYFEIAQKRLASCEAACA